ncbi:MAG TPA: hypothetical protein VE760_06485 [Acidimicrobiales bacterium]|nr:hypothetical protein [Acidimicrobiales bacterium]
MPGAGEHPGGVEDPAVAVELVLVGGVVADADRHAAGVTRPPVQLVFGGWTLAVEGEQHRESRTVEAGGMEQPGQEPPSLVGLAHSEEGGDADAGVAGPRVAVVPVALAAGVLGERGGGGGHRCPRRRVGQQAQSEQAAHHRRTLGEPVLDAVTPGAPAPLVRLEGGQARVGVDVHERFAVGDGEDDGQRPAGRDHDRRRLARVDSHRGCRLQRNGRGRPTADENLVLVPTAGKTPTFAQAGVEVDDGLHRAVLRGEPSDEQARRKESAGDLGHHALGESEAAAFGRPGRLHGGGVGKVTATDDLGGPERAEAKAARGSAAHEAAEEGLTVEAGDAQPVQGAVGGDEGGGAGVAEQRVVLDGRLGALGGVA